MSVISSGVLVRITKVGLAVVLIGGLGTAVALGSSSVSISIQSATSEVGSEVEVRLEARDIEGDVDGWSIAIEYDADILSAVTCEAFAGGSCVIIPQEAAIRVDNLNSEPLTKDLVLATVTFLCHSQGQSSLALFNQLGGVPEDLIDVRTEDGAIVCSKPSAPTPTPEEPPPSNLPSTGTGDHPPNTGTGQPAQEQLIAVVPLATLLALGGCCALALVVRLRRNEP